ncbi:MAG: hypothetical protein U0414_39900 [Polyangiaceae bacterium]
MLRAVGLEGETTHSERSVATLVAHLGFGAGLGALYAVLRKHRLVPRHPATGAAFGALVWLSSYAGWVPKLGIMPPPSKDRPFRPSVMLLAHLVYGASLERRLAETT